MAAADYAYMEDEEAKEEEVSASVRKKASSFLVLLPRRRPSRAALWLMVSVVCFSLALLLPALVEWQFRSGLVASVDLTDEGETEKSFTREDGQVIYSIYYFDLQNADQVLQGEGATTEPILVQRGPYAYLESYEMFDIEFHGATMKFFEQKWYEFDPSKSCGGCDDTKDYITTVDLVAVELLEAQLGSVLCQTKRTVSPFVRKTIHDAHWGGPDATLEAASSLLERLNQTKRAKLLGTTVPGFETNTTSQEMARHSSGLRDEVRTRKAKSMRYEKYKGSNFVRACLSPSITGDPSAYCPPQDPAWDDMPATEGEALALESGWTLAYATRDAARVHGASPTFVKPLELNKGNFGRGLFFASPKLFFNQFLPTVFFGERRYRGKPSIHVFIDSVYRSLKFSRTLKDGRISRRGLPLERYQLDRGSQLETGHPDYDQLSTPYGVLNLTRAAGLPLFATQPHFFDSDASLQSLVTGLTPSRADHNTYIDVEPRSGEVFAAAERLQFNALLFDYKAPACRFDGSSGDWPAFPDRFDTNGTRQEDGFVYPIGYIDQAYALDESSVEELKSDLKLIDDAADASFLIFFLAGLLCLALSVTTTTRNTSRAVVANGDDDLLLDDDDDDQDDDEDRLQQPTTTARSSSSYFHHLFTPKEPSAARANELPPQQQQQSDTTTPLISI